MGIILNHRSYDEVETFSQHDARAVLLNARTHLMEQAVSDPVYEAFLILGDAFDSVWEQSLGYVEGSY